MIRVVKRSDGPVKMMQAHGDKEPENGDTGKSHMGLREQTNSRMKNGRHDC
jgi:hypothetical protein